MVMSDNIMHGETESLRKLVHSNVGLKRVSFPSLSDEQVLKLGIEQKLNWLSQNEDKRLPQTAATKMPTWRCLNDSELKLILYVTLKLPFAHKHLLFLPQGQPELVIGWWWLHWQNAYLRHTDEDKVQPQKSGCLIGAWVMEENKFTL